MSAPSNDSGTVASLAVLGSFGTLIAVVVTRTPLTGPLMGLIAGTLGTVLGFYFGARGAQASFELAHAAVTSVVGPPGGAAAEGAQNPPVVVAPAAATATPQE